MFERFTQEARDALTRAREEAASLGHDFVGTEHLLLGVAAGDDGILASLGADHPALRRAVAEMYPVGPDADALASIGIDLDAVRRSVEESFGTGALFAPRPPRAKRLVLPAREAGAGARAAGSARAAPAAHRPRAPSARPCRRRGERRCARPDALRHEPGSRARRDAGGAARRGVAGSTSPARAA